MCVLEAPDCSALTGFQDRLGLGFAGSRSVKLFSPQPEPPLIRRLKDALGLLWLAHSQRFSFSLFLNVKELMTLCTLNGASVVHTSSDFPSKRLKLLLDLKSFIKPCWCFYFQLKYLTNVIFPPLLIDFPVILSPSPSPLLASSPLDRPGS